MFVLSLLATVSLISASLQETEASATPVAFETEALIDRAFQVASAMPLHPHIKNRSRAQEHVVETCLALGRPEHALRLSADIANWRKGASVARLAQFYAENGDPEKALAFAQEAESFALQQRLGAEGWRQERILSKVAEAKHRIGMHTEAAALAKQIESAESPIAKLTTFDSAQAQAFIESLPGIAQTGQLDDLLNALSSSVILYEQFFEDSQQRKSIYAGVRQAWVRAPGIERVKVGRDLIEVALRKNDTQQAMVLIGDLRVVMDGMRWNARYQVPAQAKLAHLRARAGDRSGALAELGGALEVWGNGRETVVSIYRSEALLPVAEAYVFLGELEHARAVYRMAIRESGVNPNSRPRAIDLTEILCSLARSGWKPDEVIGADLSAAEAALGDPW